MTDPSPPRNRGSKRESKRPNMEPSWLALLEEEFQAPYMRQLRAFLVEEMRRYPVYPPGSLMFNAFWQTPFAQTRVVVLGQDPYIFRGQAHGLCFSVPRGVKPPPSLVNVFRELGEDLGVPQPAHGDLTSWAEQGVLLLNTSLSVRHGRPNSHGGRGWERFTDRVVALLNQRRRGLVFMLWGSKARRKAQSVDRQRHLVLTAAHPSPRSADHGFFGCRHFSQANRHLESMGQRPIDWALPS